MATIDAVRALVEPIVASHDVDLYDVSLSAGSLAVSITRPDGIDLETITDISRAISRTLDEEDPISGSYTLEVSSPGLERTLRTASHFAGAIGSEVTVRTNPGVEGERRIKGTLVGSDETSAVVETHDGDIRTVAFADIERARTVFTWEPSPKKKTPHKEPRS